jgi:hypothetical protein
MTHDFDHANQIGYILTACMGWMIFHHGSLFTQLLMFVCMLREREREREREEEREKEREKGEG